MNPFEKVLDRLREKGWMKSDWGKPTGPNCINGAAEFAGVPDCAEFQDITGAIVLEQYPDRIEPGPVWMAGLIFNNHPDTAFEDVERVLEKAAIKWEEDQINVDS